jgi:hypothetical protein
MMKATFSATARRERNAAIAAGDDDAEAIDANIRLDMKMSKSHHFWKVTAKEKFRKHSDAFFDGFLTPFRGIVQSNGIPHRKSSAGDIAGDWRAVGDSMRAVMTAYRRTDEC